MPKQRLRQRTRVGQPPSREEFYRNQQRRRKPYPKFKYGIHRREAEALEWLYANTGGDSWSDNTGWLSGFAGDWAGVTVSNRHVVSLNLLSWWDNNLDGDITDFPIHKLRWCAELVFGGNSNLTGDISGWIIPLHMRSLNLYSTGLSGDITKFTIPERALFWAFDNSSVEGDCSAWVVPASLAQLALTGTSVVGVPDFSQARDIAQVLVADVGLSQAEVDLYAQRLYERRFKILGTYFGGDLDLALDGASNASPSGTYQDADPPTTGKEYIFELENDPDTEGFNTWSVDFNA